MARPALPTLDMAIVDAQNSSTVQFNSWLGSVDDAVALLTVGRREPLPQDAVVEARHPTTPFAKWLIWVDRGVVTLGGKRQPLPPAGFVIVGMDSKATIPFFSWCRYVDRMLP